MKTNPNIFQETTLTGESHSFNKIELMKIEEFEPAIWIKTFIFMIFGYLEMRWEITSLLALLIALDTLTGVMKIIRLNLGFSVKELYWGLSTKFLILLIPHLIAAIGKILGLDWIYMINLIIYVMIANDFTSILTNILCIKTKKLHKNMDLIEMLYSSIKDGIRNWVETKIKNYNPPQDTDDETKQ